MATANKTMSATKVVIPCRISFANIFEPKSINGGDAKYSVSCLIPKADKKTLLAIHKAVEAAKEDGKTRKWGGKIPPNLKMPLRDGDIDRPDDENYQEHFFLNATSKDAPQVVDRHVQPVTDPMMVYSGCYCNVSDTKNLVGDELVASAIKSAMAELGPNEVTNRTKIEPLAQQKLAESLNQKYGEGAVFINKVVINNMDFEEAYNTAIQQKSIAQQNADKQKIENEAAIAKAEADKQVAITNAEAEAQKTSIAADAQAEANRKIAESLSDTLIEYQKIQKWDGKLPTVSGSNALVSIDPAE